MSDTFVGLDVSQRTTSICVIDGKGTVLCEGKSLTRPGDIHGWLGNRVDLGGVTKVGLEAGTMSSWLHGGLCEAGLPVVCLETFQAHRFLATFRNKTDRNDARGLAQLVRMGGEDFLKVVAIRSQAAQETRALLAMRDHLVGQRVGLENHLTGIIKPFGLVVARGGICAETFLDRVIEALALAEDKGIGLRDIAMPSLDLHRDICSKITPLSDRIDSIANSIEVVRRFQDIPGVGPITALSYYAAVDNPERFRKPCDVAAYFGLTPRQYQSGETDFMVGISKRGDPATRRALVNAATVLLFKSREWSTLRAWGVRLAKRIGYAKARIAVARKLAIIMHRIWSRNERFRPKPITLDERRALAQMLKARSTPQAITV